MVYPLWCIFLYSIFLYGVSPVYAGTFCRFVPTLILLTRRGVLLPRGFWVGAVRGRPKASNRKQW